MKNLIKRIYMIVFRWRVLFFCEHRGKNCFIGKRAEINKPRFIFFSDNVRIGNDVRLSFYEKFNGELLNPRLFFGSKVYIGNRFTVLCADEVIIEDNVLIASDVMITSENHGMDPENSLHYNKQSLTTNKVKICNGAWLGEKVSVLPGVTIGEKAIIATGSVVTKNIPPYTIAAGAPAKIIKEYNFEKHCWEKIQ